MYSVIIIAIFITFMLIQSIIHRLERKDLYNRIMARDLNDYNRAETKAASTKEPSITRNPLRKQVMRSEKEHHEKFMRGEID